MKHVGVLSVVAAVALMASASAAYAQSDNKDKDKNNDKNPIISLAATPELDSVVLLSSALVGGAGYVALRRRASKS